MVELEYHEPARSEPLDPLRQGAADRRLGGRGRGHRRRGEYARSLVTVRQSAASRCWNQDPP
jgi:hypothetical protein